ncbi:hypothetical protein RHSIM_Rhsim04G0133000 [Rhododendron simsii]|uniref:Chromatin assembly factor 1 subunit FAS1 n=1 Tax=Rhododendron simsii TaxID=118357 RepID=A0A834H3X3_RHOSS|nr:hypothetical protein RHSIM_Rhsim04G0133000 [Rhododendron simsii]
MADLMLIDVVESKSEEKTLDQNNNGAKKNPKKRKRAPSVETLTPQERDSRIGALNEELEGLFRYFKEVLGEKVSDLDSGRSECGSSSSNTAIACLLEESDLSLSKLVGEIYEKVKGRDGGVTVASVKSSVVFVGQRCLYGVPNADADVLEDETESCLWCWETRDLKLMPKSVRETLKTRRICRKKIHERITAVSGMITALQKSESHPNYRDDLTKASERLHKISSEADIRLLVQNLEQKNGAKLADKQGKREEKQLIRQVDRDKREAEKERIRLDRELKKEKWQSEKELKRLQDEAEKEERRREKEESELRKHQRRQQEEAEKEQRRREKEEAELKKQLSLKKQASLMERFLKRSKNNSTCQNDQSSTKATLPDSSSNKSENISESVTLSMDHALSLTNNANVEDIHNSHLISWRRLGHEIRSNRKQHWGIRRTPKKDAIKELKLSTNKGLAHDDELSMEKLVDGWGEIKVDGRSCDTDADSSVSLYQRHFGSKKLLQFDKSCRPAFYGVWPKKSQVTGPRNPFRKDPDLDYDVDSDEEWEEEEPGESLSDCDKDDEEEKLEEGYSKDEDDSEDGFFVPDGYLSDNEGVQVDRKESDCLVEETKSLPGCKQELESEEMCVLLRQQRCLHNMTERALRKNQPLIISNLMHENASLSMTEELTDARKLEQMCLQALSMRIFSGGPSIKIVIDYYYQEDDQENCTSNNKGCTTPVATPSAISDSDLPEIVSSIQSCSQGINKVVESLQQKFPSASKSLLRNKVREVSDFMDNRWQVKKDILDKLGLSSSPDKVGGRRKSIATFFSKRCLPPTNGRTVNQTETSPQSTQKPSTVVQSQPEYINNAT